MAKKCFLRNLFARKKKTNELAQELNKPLGEKRVDTNMSQLLRQCSAEGLVLLKNDGVLPLQKGQKIALFGRCQNDYFYVGYGSGGDVNPPYLVSPAEAFATAESEGLVELNKQLLQVYKEWGSEPENIPDNGTWGHWPLNYKEMPLTNSLVKAVAKESEVAIVFVGRASGEDRESLLKKGSYYLTKTEMQMLNVVTKNFNKTVVVLDCGNIIDLSWQEKFGNKISAILYAWQGGMESGNALVDVLCGKVNPSASLTDTIVRHYQDYPSAQCFGGKDFNCYQEDIYVGYRYFETFAPNKVLYPFGYGLSYTQFDTQVKSFVKGNDNFALTVDVKNIGKLQGKKIVQVYVAQPQGKLGKASKVLVAFDKTKELKPQESQTLQLSFTKYDFASFDDCGATNNIHAYVLESGEYQVLVGDNVRDTKVVGKIDIATTEVLEQLQSACGVQEGYYRIYPKANKKGELKATKQLVLPSTSTLKQRILDNLPSAVEYTGDLGYKLNDVKDGKITIEQFVAQLTNDELEALSRGVGYMNSDLGVVGNAGAYGGVLQSLRDKGVKPIITTDGPAGIRVRYYASLLPCGTAMASSWNTQLIEQVYSKVGEEMKLLGSNVLLAPGMNIHRNPLCGRNFEYFAEDPMLSGMMASAVVKGLQSQGVSACPKHFACNNQEYNRNYNDSRVSERALREIYLKGFEICVKNSHPLNIMTSYNKINGVWSHYNYDLATTILRQEWGYKGLVITDWWMRPSHSPEFPEVRDNAYRVRAQVDVLMPGGKAFEENEYISDGTLLETLGHEEGITRGELQRTAINTLQLVMRLM